MNGDDDVERWLEIAGRILDGQPVAWDTMPGGRPTDDASADALRVIAEVAALHRAPAGEPGRRWGTLAIQEQIGHGTFGDVYRARDAALDRDVALKLVDHTPSATAPDEGRLLARVRHSNVVTVHGAAVHDGRYGIWMEFIRGRTLAAIVREHGPLAAEDVTAIGIDVCRALTAVHASGLLHGDIKPQNVMREEGGRIVVMDFGTGRVVTDGAARDRLAGTPLYLAPEVLTGAAPDVRADLYSAGVLLYYLLTGAHPVEGRTLDEVRAAHASGARTPVRSRRPEMPRLLAAIIDRATAVEPSTRFESAAAFDRALRESSATRSRAFSKRHATLIARGIAAALLVSAFALLATRPDLWRRDAGPQVATSDRQITFVGDAASPAISRDGRFLAYITGATSSPQQQKLMVQDLNGGQPRQVFEGQGLQTPVWSYDGSELIITSAGPGSPGVRIVPRLGGPPRSFGGQVLAGASWSPDNTRFAGILPGMKRIVFVDKETGRFTSIQPAGSFASITAVDWSPAGDWLLFQTVDREDRHKLWTIRADGSGQERLVDDVTPLSSPRWSPTGDAVYYLRDAKQLLKMPVSPRTGKATGLPKVLLGLQTRDPFTISGNGKQLAYVRIVSHASVWVASTTLSSDGGKEVRQLTSGTPSDAYPNFSPDGARIAFSRMDGNKAHIFVMPSEGGIPQQITFLNSSDLGPVWSPNGRTIAFKSTDDGQAWGRLRQVSAAGGSPRTLEQVQMITTTVDLAWAPGSRILYSDRGKDFQVLNPLTGEQRSLLEYGSLGGMRQAHMSPDGSQVAVTWNRSGDGLWLIPIRKPSEATLLAAPIAPMGIISQSVDASPLRGRDVSFVAHVKASVSGSGNDSQCFLRVHRLNGKSGFFGDTHDQPVHSWMWTEVAMAARIADDAERVDFGCTLAGIGQMWIDDIRLEAKNPAGQWEVVPIKNPGFEESDNLMSPVGWTVAAPGYVFQITDAKPYEGKRCLAITSGLVYGRFAPIGWSSDGKYVYAIESTRSKEVVMIRADGSKITPVIDLPLAEGFSTGEVAITPDGHRVVFTALQGLSDVWIVQNFDRER
jgi:serine/threonine-protein kinase